MRYSENHDREPIRRRNRTCCPAPPDPALVPYQAVIGERGAAAGQIAVRRRDGRRLPRLPAAAALTSIAAHAAAHRTELWDAAA